MSRQVNFHIDHSQYNTIGLIQSLRSRKYNYFLLFSLASGIGLTGTPL